MTLERRRELARMTKALLIEHVLHLEREVTYLGTGEYPEEANREDGGNNG